MAIYRVQIPRDDGDGEYCENAGYEYFTNKRDAQKVARKHETDETSITSEPTPKTKADVVHLLNIWASHPDNG